jgi:hypothetical protein
MTKADKNGRAELSIEQANAIDLLVVGKTDQEVATAVGVSRQTVCGWRLYHPDFQAELNKRRREVWGAAADKLRSLLPKALEVLERELEEGDVKVALDIVKLAGVQISNIGPHDPEEIVATEARTRDAAVLFNLGGTTDLARVRKELIEKAAAE